MSSDPVASYPRRTIRGGGAHPELAAEHPGLFLGADAVIEVEMLAPDRWRIVTDESVADSVDDASEEAAPSESVPVAVAPEAPVEEAGATLLAEPASASEEVQAAPPDTSADAPQETSQDAPAGEPDADGGEPGAE